jgi:hypothetical protein
MFGLEKPRYSRYIGFRMIDIVATNYIKSNQNDVIKDD